MEFNKLSGQLVKSAKSSRSRGGLKRDDLSNLLGQLREFSDSDYHFVKAFEARSSKMGPFSKLFDAQLVVQRWALKVNLVTRVGESISATLRRFQGGG